MQNSTITIRGISVAISKSRGMFRAYEIAATGERYLLAIAPTHADAVSIATRSLSDVDEMLANGANEKISAKRNILKRIVDNRFQQG